MSAQNASPADNKQPISLGEHEVPVERAALIRSHIAMLSETARAVSDQLAFGADVGDVIGVLEANGDDAGGNQ